MAEIDRTSGGLRVIQHAHTEIHQGEYYSVSKLILTGAFDIATPIEFLVETAEGPEQVHMTVNGEFTKSAYWEVFEDNGNPGHFQVVAGLAKIPTNRNRSLADEFAAKTVIKFYPNVVKLNVNKTLVLTEAIAPATFSDIRDEFVLKPSTKYFVRCTSYRDDNEGSFSLHWYEHAPL